MNTSFTLKAEFDNLSVADASLIKGIMKKFKAKKARY